jgi:hypothetical protein
MKKIVLLLLAFGYILPVTAQMNRGMNNGLSRGMNDMISTSNNDGKKEKKDPIVATMEYLKKELSLDDFQEAAIKSYLLENISESEKVNATSLNPEEKREKFIQLKNTFDEKTKSILNPNQKELFIKLSEDLKGNKKSKKKNKKKEEEN